MCLKSCFRMCHWGPLIALGTIKWISLVTVYCNTMWWPPETGWGGTANMVCFMLLSTLTTFHFLSAMCEGPGQLPLNWTPENQSETNYLQFCTTCSGYKAPRAHHCRKCNRCVLKMDHHCPWINNCVGHFNHGHFVAFTLFAVVGSAQAAVTLACTLYYGLNRSWYLYYGSGHEPVIVLTIWSLMAVIFGLGLAIGVVVAVGALLFFQLRSILRNQTGIEDWILTKAKFRRKGTGDKFQHPYHLGKWLNLRQVVTWNCLPPGNGIDWDLAEGAHPYALTIEQLEQKQEKRQRTRMYKIVRDYSGAWCPVWSQGFRVACHPPCTDEARIAVRVGDEVNATRWRKHWLYGDKVARSENGCDAPTTTTFRVRGWFPRRCAVDIKDEESPGVTDAKKNA